MRPISAKTRRVLENEKRMKKCCLYDLTCFGRIQWHHNHEQGGRQSDNPKHILPVCEGHHERARETETKERLDLVMLSSLTEQELKDISKAVNYSQRLSFLKKKYDNH